MHAGRRLLRFGGDRDRPKEGGQRHATPAWNVAPATVGTD